MKLTNLRNRLADTAGTNLVELMATILIASIAVSGMVMAYADGIEKWNRTSDKMVLYNEGTSSLALIERFVRRAEYVNTAGQYMQPSTYLTVMVPIFNGSVMTSREADFYYVIHEKSLRWNDLTGNSGIFNQQLVPISSFYYDRGEKPYLEVQNVTFTPIDPDIPNNSSSDGFNMIKIELVMNDARGDTLTLSSVVTKRNKPN
jgi:Tfp pilus assembly protein PilE